MVRIIQILANFPGKIQIWTLMTKFQNVVKKAELFLERLLKICCELFLKGGHWARASGKKGSKKVLVSAPPPHLVHLIQ